MVEYVFGLISDINIFISHMTFVVDPQLKCISVWCVCVLIFQVNSLDMNSLETSVYDFAMTDRPMEMRTKIQTEISDMNIPANK